MTRTPHDALAKAALSRPENAAGALRAVLPPDVLGQLDLGTLRPVSGSYVDERLAARMADLVFEVLVAGKPGLVCFLLYEHQSTVDPLMAVHLLLYVARLWDDWLAANPGATKVPAVIPVVLYQGPDPWIAPTSLEETIDVPGPARAALRAYLPGLRYVLDDLTAIDDADIRRREMAVMGRLSLLLLKHARSVAPEGEGPGSLLHLLRAVRDLLLALPDRGDRVRVFSHMMEVVRDADPNVVEDAAREVVDPDLREDAMTAGKTFRERALLEGERRLLLRMLRIKFGPLSGETEARLAAAEEEDLATWSERILTATALEDVWGPE